MKCAIKYFSFWDVPRTFAFESKDKFYILTSEFDEQLDEYPDQYEAFVVPGRHKLSAITDWKDLATLPRVRLGIIPIKSVLFDKSRRKFVDDTFLDHFAA